MILDPNIWMIEYWMNLAFAAHVSASGVLDVAKQKDQDGLTTPRVEVKTIWNGWSNHRFGGWYDQGTGKLAIRIVTKRMDDSQFHDRVVGTLRYLMQFVLATPGYTPGDPNPKTLSDRMPYHKIGNYMIDTGGVPQFVANELQDVTALSFDFALQVRTEKFPTP